MGAEMKGLQQFIADLRNVESKEEQDKRINSEIVNIQKQFAQNKLTGYQRKKYVSKLIYIYLTSSCNINAYNVSLGQGQITQLISSKVYTEKFIGYLAVALLMNNVNDSDMLTTLVQSLKKDLSTADEESNLLALQCIATLGNTIWSELLIEEVFQVLRSPTASPLLKKRSALAFFKLVRANPDSLRRHRSWIPRILALCDDQNFGVVLSILPVVELIAVEIDFESAKDLIPTLAKKLSQLITDKESIPQDYYFGGVPCPWLIVKLAKLLTVLMPDSKSLNIDLNSLRTLRECVSITISDIGSRASSDSSVKNVYNAVLFAIINLATHLDPSPEALSSSVDAITRLLDSHEMNTKYLALDSLIKLSSEHSTLHTSQKHLLKILHLLNEQDVSISRKALDLVYVLADVGSSGYIVSELLKIMKSADPVLRSEIAIKVSVLSEKFATDPQWFVNTNLQLIDMAGPQLNDSIWQRVTQIVVNNELLQEFTCKTVFQYIMKSNFAEAIVKIAAYVLGEFGAKIIDEYPLGKQFDILSKLYFYVANDTRQMLLTTLMKLLKFDLENKKLKSKLIKLLRLEVNSINSELQQRSLEYLNMIQRLNTSQGQMFYRFVFDEVPVFNTKQNPLLLRLGKTNPSAKRELVKSTDDLARKIQQNGKDTILEDDEYSDEVDTTDPFKENSTTTSTPMTSAPTSSRGPPPPVPTQNRGLEGPLTPNWEVGFYRLFEFNQGVFFENSLIKILARITPHDSQKELIFLQLTFQNKSPQPLTSFITTATNYRTIKPNVVINLVDLPSTDIPINGRATSTIEALLRGPLTISDIPNLRIQFSSGGAFNNVRLKLPIFLTKFITPTALQFPQFLQHWKQIDVLGANGEAVENIQVRTPVDYTWLVRFLGKLGLALIEQNATSFLFGGGILHTSTVGKLGTLLKVKYVDEYNLEFRFRTTKDGVAQLLMEYVVNYFKRH